MRADQRTFIKDELRTPTYTIALFVRYGFEPPTLQSVEKWFLRGRVPAASIIVILGMLELEQGAPLSLTKYVVPGE